LQRKFEGVLGALEKPVWVVAPQRVLSGKAKKFAVGEVGEIPACERQQGDRASGLIESGTSF
jgi:hypothetical protein